MVRRDNLDLMRQAIERHAGNEAADRIMEERDRINKSTPPDEVAKWISGAVGRMDDLLDAETRRRIMGELGRNCATFNSRVMQATVNRRKKHGTLEEFIESEIRKPPRGTRLERDGDRIIQVYAPHSWTRPMRCYCAFINRLPEDMTAPLTYCECSRAFVETVWEAVTGKPVRVELLQSTISGADECRFAIYL
jgi:hypothetical protein